MDEKIIKGIISNAIHSAICIDDQYLEPYMDSAEGKSADEPAALYNSLRDEAACSLDICCYSDYDSFNEKKEALLRGKDLVIIDWELTQAEPKYADALRIIDELVSDEQHSLIVVYTSSPDYVNIAAKIHGFFHKLKKDSYNLEEIEESLLDSATENNFEAEDVDQIFPIDSSTGFTFYPDRRRQIKKDLEKEIKKRFGNSSMRVLTNYMRDDRFYIWHDLLSGGNLTDMVTTLDCVTPEAVNTNSIKVNGTLIIVLQKSDAEEREGVKASKVYEEIVSSIQNSKNSRSFLFTMMLKGIIGCELTKFGVGISSISDAAIIEHAKTYDGDDDGLMDYISRCTSCYISNIVKTKVSPKDIKDIFSQADTTYEQEELIRFNKILTFTEKSQMANKTKLIMTGDIFKLNTPFCKVIIGKERFDCDYLICITQGCDCARADKKINYNYAFAIGTKLSKTKLKDALENVETKILSFVSDQDVILWSQRFLTIHIEHHHEFELEVPIGVNMNDGQAYEMTYLGNQSEYYTQRVINSVFNYAMRIGIDLPHMPKDSKEE